MLRAPLLILTLACIPAVAQTSEEIQARVAAQQNLIRVLGDDVARYTPQHPRVPQLRALINVLEEQARLLQQPKESWPPAAVQEQVRAITTQLSILRNQVANYQTSHPDMRRSRAIIDLLKEELRSLK
jgi:uncharacterized protein involved in exopolysaccharide biosynthesis